MTSPLSPTLLAFADATPDLGTAKALTIGRDEAKAFVELLVERKLRGHLEALGEVASDKDVKKAARAAAYKLKSQGVQAAPLPKQAGVDLSVKAELDRVAIASAPGLDGHLWLVIASLPGAGGGELDVRDPERGPRLEVVEELALGRVRRGHAEMAAQARLQKPLLADAALVARLLDYAAADLDGTPKFNHFTAWRDRAVKLGADPLQWDARGKLGPAGRPIPRAALETFANHPIVGYIAPPGAALERMEKELAPLVHDNTPIEKGDFVARFEALSTQNAARWSADEAARNRGAHWLEATADVLFFAGEPDQAKVALALADDLRAWDPAGGAHPLVSFAFETNLDVEAAWHHREAHAKGEAHH